MFSSLTSITVLSGWSCSSFSSVSISLSQFNGFPNWRLLIWSYFHLQFQQSFQGEVVRFFLRQESFPRQLNNFPNWRLQIWSFFSITSSSELSGWVCSIFLNKTLFEDNLTTINWPISSSFVSSTELSGESCPSFSSVRISLKTIQQFSKSFS